MSLKSISLLLIFAYILLPTFCYAHPCELNLSSSAETSQITASQQGTDCPITNHTDNCETTCCCDGHFLTAFTAILYVDQPARQLPYDLQSTLPRLIDRIFVPPQNHS